MQRTWFISTVYNFVTHNDYVVEDKIARYFKHSKSLKTVFREFSQNYGLKSKCVVAAERSVCVRS